MPVYLETAVAEGWSLKLKCERRRAGLKSARPCPMPSVLHLPTLLSALGPGVELDRLRFRCPQCGSEAVSISWVRPPGAGLKRKMKPIDRREWLLGRYTGPRIVVACKRCRRRGDYLTATLLARFGPDTVMAEVARRVAEAGGCYHARAAMMGEEEAERGGCKAFLDVD